MSPGASQPPCGEPVAVLGHSIKLPGGVDTVDAFVQLVRDKTQCQRDLVEAGRLLPFSADREGSGNPWKLRAYRGNLFPDEEGKWQKEGQMTLGFCCMGVLTEHRGCQCRARASPQSMRWTATSFVSR
jgi:hypothetical protein